MTNRFVACTLLLVSSVGMGCGGGEPTATLQGTVLVDGEPLPHGTISFTPLEPGRGKAVSAQIEQGKYTARNVPLGRVRVLFHAVAGTGKMLFDRDAGREYEEMVSLVADEYQITGIEITVEPGSQTQDFEVSAP
jgi:hypothetical protein